jgi:hypothetical protein
MLEPTGNNFASSILQRTNERTFSARAAVEVLRVRIADKNATPESRIRAISIARVLAQRATSGTDAQRFISTPPFVNTLKNVASDPVGTAWLMT